MRSAAVLAALALLVSAATAAAAPERQEPAGDFIGHLDTRVPELLDRYDVPGLSVALIVDGQLAWSAAYGHAEAARQQPMTPGAVYRTESISKPVTAWGVMRLVEQDELDLDDPVLDHVTSWRPPAAVSTMSDITIRQLLSHSSGLALGSVGVHYPPTDEVPALRDNLTREVELLREPGSAFHYSNPGFNLLEVLIEDVSGEDFDDYMRREVLIPLGMDHSGFAWTRAVGAAAPRGHTLSGAAVDEYVYPENASGGLRATIDDLGRFVAAGMPAHSRANATVLRAESLRELYAPTVEMAGIYRAVSEAHGLGYFIETLPNGRRAVFYGGQGDGWLTHIHAVPETGDGFVVLTNSQRSWPLIAHLVTDWAEWSQESRLGMSRILTATIALWALIGLLATFAVAQGGRVIRQMTTGRHRVGAGSSTARRRRFAAGVAALMIVATLVWAVSREYLFVTSVFPLAAPWLGGALLAVAAILALTALAPRREAREGS